MAGTPPNGLADIISLFSKDEGVEAGSEHYDPNRLLDALGRKMRLENDAALACRLQVAPPILAMIRQRRITMSAPMFLMWVRETTGLAMQELRELMDAGKSD